MSIMILKIVQESFLRLFYPVESMLKYKEFSGNVDMWKIPYYDYHKLSQLS